MKQNESEREHPGWRYATWLIQGIGHVSATLLIAAALMWLFLPARGMLDVIEISFTTPQLLNASLEQFGMLVLFSGMLWGTIVMSYSVGRQRWTRRRRASVRLSRGTVMTETLIILPVFFLLTFGLAQLSINMIAGILANVAGWSASRAVWVWAPEAAAGRRGVTNQIVTERARSAAAMVMTPVTSGEYFSLTGAFSDLPDTGVDMRRAIVKGQILVSNDTLIRLGAVGTKRETSISSALGSDTNFVVQSVRKFTRAYACTTITPVQENGMVGATFSYEHYLGMPFIGPIMAGNGFFRLPDFPSSKNGQRAGYYLNYTRKFMIRAQQPVPNVNPPDNQFFGSDPPAYGGASGEITNNTGSF